MRQLRNKFFLALLTLVSNAYGDNLKVADFTINTGDTYDLSVELENPDYQYIMTEFWMSLPDGVSIAKNSDDDFIYEESNRFDKTHSLTISKENESNVYHFLIYSSKNKAFSGNSGELFKITLEAASNTTTGKFQGQIFGQVFSDLDKQEHNPADVTFNVTIEKQGTQKCATPTISFVNGKLKFSCETEGVEFCYDIKNLDAATGIGSEIQMPENTEYLITVYAKKDGYMNSEEASMSLIRSVGIKGDANGDGEVDIADAVHIINFIVGKISNLAPQKNWDQQKAE